MHLSQLLMGLNYTLVGNGDVKVTSLACDTSKVKQGAMYFCLKGDSFDGHDFFRKALGDGASVIVCQRQLDTKATQIVVDDTRAFMSLVAKRFYHNAVDKLKVICVVGTNGKTSTTYLLDAIFNKAGYNTGVIGSNGVFINGHRYDSKLTTPDPIELNYWFYQMYLNKVHFVFMELSAHAIYYKKMYGIVSDLTVFTNFSQDHLDFFADMEQYKQTKKSHFGKYSTKIAVVNCDDSVGREIMQETNLPLVTYGCGSADVSASQIQIRHDGISYLLDLYGEKSLVNYSLCGKFNVYNTLAASTVAKLFGISVDNIVEGLSEVKFVEGRNETMFRNDGMRIVVDFAHTPDGIVNILSYLKSTCKGNLIVVFGCGGNRDKFKRPLMAQAVSKFADFAVVTNDNPRFEAPTSIVDDLLPGMTCQYKVILNRSQATEFALSVAKVDDTVAILGKGAEKFQEIKGRKYPYCDVDVVHKIISRQGE